MISNILDAFQQTKLETRNKIKGIQALHAMHRALSERLNIIQGDGAGRFGNANAIYLSSLAKSYEVAREKAMMAGVRLHMLPKNIVGGVFT